MQMSQLMVTMFGAKGEGGNLESATVEDAAKDDIVLTFTGTVTATTAATGHTYSVNGGADTSPTAVISSNVLTLTMAAPIEYGDTVTWSYDDSGDMAIGGVQLEAVTDSGVINNIAAAVLTITSQPTNQSVSEPNAATFTITATGQGTITYQWKLNGSNISGANSSNYSTGATTEGQTGSYTCEVNDDNGTPLLSSAASLTVNAAVPSIRVHYPDYLGFNNIEVTDLIAAIDMHETTNAAPLVIACSAATSTATGTTNATGAAVNVQTHIEWRWRLVDSGGNVPTNWVNNGLGTLEPVSNNYVNDYTDQVGPMASFPIYELDPDTYTVILTGRAPNDSGGYITSTTTADFAVTKAYDNFMHVWVDAVTGDAGNTGFDPFGSAYTNQNYDDTTGIITTSNAFVTAFANQILPTASISPAHTNQYHYLGGECRRGEYLDADRFQVVTEDRTGLVTGTYSADSADGPIDQYPNKADYNADDYALHMNGNAGASSYLQTVARFGLGLHYSNAFMIGYNGDPADNYLVTMTFNGGATSQAMVIAGGIPDVFVSNMRLDCANLAGLSMYLLVSSEIETLTWRFIIDNSASMRAAQLLGMGAQDSSLTTRTKSQFAITGGFMDNKSIAGASKSHCLLTGIGDTGWLAIRGWNLTGDSDNSHLDHYIYNSGYSNRQSVTCCHAYGADVAGGKTPGFFLNGNAAHTTSANLELFFTADNLATECLYYADSSANDLGNASAFFTNVLHARAYCAGLQGHIYAVDTHSLTALDCIMDGKDKIMADPQFMLAANASSGIQEDYFLERNIVVNAMLSNPHAVYDGLSTRETINNNLLRDDGTRLAAWKTEVMVAGNYHTNNLYSTTVNEILDKTSNANWALVTAENAVIAEGGFASNTTNVPDWQDYTNDNFLPVGFESSAPTVNIQPVATITQADGEYMVLTTDFDQATSHQWQVDTVDIVGQESPVLTLLVATADNGKVYRCVGTNAAGSTNSDGCMLTVGSGALILTLNAANLTWLQNTLGVGSTSGDTISFDLASTGSTSSEEILGSTSGNPPQMRLAAGNAVTWTDLSVTLLTIDGNAITRGANISAYMDGTFYPWVVTLPAGIVTNLIGRHSSNVNYGNYSIRKYATVGTIGTYAWNIDGGQVSGATEDSTPTGNLMAFNNVVAGDWS